MRWRIVHRSQRSPSHKGSMNNQATTPFARLSTIHKKLDFRQANSVEILSLRIGQPFRRQGCSGSSAEMTSPSAHNRRRFQKPKTTQIYGQLAGQNLKHTRNGIKRQQEPHCKSRNARAFVFIPVSTFGASGLIMPLPADVDSATAPVVRKQVKPKLKRELSLIPDGVLASLFPCFT